MIRNRSAPGKGIIKSPSLWIGFLGFTVLVTAPFLFHENPVISFKIDDLSVSSVNSYTPLIQAHCQARINQIKEGDTVIDIQFADYAIVTRHENVDNAFKLRKYCNQKQQTMEAINRNYGTSLTLALERLWLELSLLREEGNNQPVIVTLILHAAEPVPNQAPLDLANVKDLIQKITEDKGMVTIIGTTKQLESDLAQLRHGIANFKLCPSVNLQSCIEDAYVTARHYGKGGN